ncbi:MAG TPA: hypothetical protein PKW75_08345 [candidate division Zixibacteria bacterium]|nr:hypothetical protein [candidate division Zixibacteria bacterium]MDD4916394.1 hypothetical protein [candidate division Zixibacteria bacterium]MDM7972593.1 hypothetical protein [candidate division Zixibacteria bacterium]HOD65681.1 hypothetical protein [candidate division Zixibacteria bacterium]HOZ08282.1 hypothetical protein [candidate division Zixibacteria bacterium]
MKRRRFLKNAALADDVISYRPAEPDPSDGPPGAPPREDGAPEEVEADVIRSDGRPMYQLDTRAPEALVIHCGDPRFQTAFRRFVTEELGIRTYTPIVVGGGAHAFGAQVFLPKNFKVLWEQVKFFTRQQNLRRVIIINHEDCLWYRSMKGYHPTVEVPVKGKLDLRHAAQTIVRDFAGIHVESYWAALAEDRVYFVPVAPRAAE